MSNPFTGQLHAYIGFGKGGGRLEITDDSGEMTPRHAHYAANAIKQHEALVAQRDTAVKSLEELRELLGPDSEYSVSRTDRKLLDLAEWVAIGSIFERADAVIAHAKGMAG